MSHEIGIVIGGYLDENNKLMSRAELDKRISKKDSVIKELERKLESFAENRWMEKYYDKVEELVAAEAEIEIKAARIKQLETLCDAEKALYQLGAYPLAEDELEWASIYESIKSKCEALNKGD